MTFARAQGLETIVARIFEGRGAALIRPFSLSKVDIFKPKLIQ